MPKSPSRAGFMSENDSVGNDRAPKRLLRGVRVWLLAVVFLGLAAVVSFVGIHLVQQESVSPADGPASADPARRPAKLQIGFVSPGSKSDWSFNYQHYRGCLGLEAQLRDRVETAFVADLSDPSRAELFMADMCERGRTLVFATERDYSEAALRLAESHPAVTFIQFLGGTLKENVGTYAVRDWESAYVCGVVAALVADANGRIGLVAAYPNGPGIWVPNAFCLGARSVDPEATVVVEYLANWYDPAGEVRAVQRLVERGVGAIYFLTISPIAGLEAAEAAEINVLAHFADLSFFAPERWLTGGVWELAGYYTKIAQEVLDRTWTSRHDEIGFAEGALSLARHGVLVPVAAIEKARDVQSRIVSGELEIFSGPLVDRQGTVRVAAGTTMTPREIRGTGWLVEGVEAPREPRASGTRE